MTFYKKVGLYLREGMFDIFSLFWMPVVEF